MTNQHRYLSKSAVSESFHDKRILLDIWGHPWGVTNSIGPIRKVLVHRPGQEIKQLHHDLYEIEASSLLLNKQGKQPKDSGSEGPPNLDVLTKQHDTLTDLLEKEGVEVVRLDGSSNIWPERMFVRDLGMVIPGGIILSRFAIYLRYGETRMALETLSKQGMPILGMLQGHAYAEGGSFTMLDNHTALIGRSERVNHEGIEQLKQLLAFQHIELLVIDLPASKIHLDEAFLLLDKDKALINPALLPYWFLEELHLRKIKLLHVDPEDPSLTINCLAVAPGRVIFPESGVRTMELLSKNGIDIIPVDVSELYKMGGGIHCATLPLSREDL
jgi:N-dimethylarginine dimethylaminohydrolase